MKFFEMKVFDRKIFHDGNFEICPNPSKSIASNSELALIPLFACFTVFMKYIQACFWNQTKSSFLAYRRHPFRSDGAISQNFSNQFFFLVWQKFYLTFVLLKTLLACADLNISENQWSARGDIRIQWKLHVFKRKSAAKVLLCIKM